MFTVTIVFLLGLSIGSFVNVLIYRLPRNVSLSGRSYCDHCGKNIPWYDLIPLLSFILLGGKCRFCKKRIEITIPIVELTTALLFVTLSFKFPILSDPKLWFYFFIVSVFIAIFFIDLKKGIVPDKLVYPALIVSLSFVLLNSNPLNFILSGLGAFLFFLAVSLITRGRGIGGGDIKLALVLGLVLGFPKILICLYLAFLTGAISGLILVLWRKKKFKRGTIPFGPFLILGALISIFLGDRLVSLLLNFL